MSTKEETNNKNVEDSDVRLLREMGYSQELYRGFSPLMSFAFCFTAVSIFTSVSLGFTFTLHTGGSSVAIWSWLIGSFFTILVGLSLAEICSVYPSAGSVYHWAGQLVSPKRAPLASFICGWFNFIGNAAGDASFASGFATIINAAIFLSGRSEISDATQVAIGVGILFLWAVQNALRIDQQGWLNNLAAAFQIISIIVTVIILLSMSSHRATVHDVFTTTFNDTGFPFVYVCCIGILSTLFAFSGYEAGAHLSEETRGAGRAAPKGIVGTCVCGAIVGLMYLLALLFAIPNVKTFVETNSGDNEPINLAVAAYELALPKSTALALTILLIINLYFGGVSSVTVTTRIGFAMARDGVFPCSSYLRWVYEGTKTPLANIIFVFCIDSLLILLQLVSTTAFTALIAMSVLGMQLSYLMPIFFRCTSARKSFVLGEFNLGRFGVPVAIISSAWLSITSLIMLLPTEYPVTADNMNYTCVVIGGVLCIAGIYWFVSARHWFIGPKRTDSDATPLLPGHVTAEDKTNSDGSPDIVQPR